MNERKYHTPLEVLKIATQHAYSAEYLLTKNASTNLEIEDIIAPAISLLYIAFDLTFKAYLQHANKKYNQNINLLDLSRLTPNIFFSENDKQFLQQLSKHHGYNKNYDDSFWSNREKTRIFCFDLLNLYERLQKMMPLELQKDYQ